MNKLKTISHFVLRNINLIRFKRKFQLPKKKFILLHCPRSGGTFFKLNIFKYVSSYKENNNFKQIEENELNFKKLPSFYLSHSLWTKFSEENQKYVQWICLVREPTERIISRYFSLKNIMIKKNKYSKNIVNDNNFSLADYCKHLNKNCNDNLLCRMLVNKLEVNDVDEIKPQKLIKNSKITEYDFEIAKRRLSKMDVVNTENIAFYLNKKFNIPLKKMVTTSKNESLKEVLNISKKDKKLLLDLTYWDRKLYEQTSYVSL